jgi:hypothetical protein
MITSTPQMPEPFRLLKLVTVVLSLYSVSSSLPKHRKSHISSSWKTWRQSWSDRSDFFLKVLLVNEWFLYNSWSTKDRFSWSSSKRFLDFLALVGHFENLCCFKHYYVPWTWFIVSTQSSFHYRKFIFRRITKDECRGIGMSLMCLLLIDKVRPEGTYLYMGYLHPN